jgi:hypothetical protein
MVSLTYQEIFSGSEHEDYIYRSLQKELTKTQFPEVARSIKNKLKTIIDKYPTMKVLKRKHYAWFGNTSASLLNDCICV